jgi:hypothetical protein
LHIEKIQRYRTEALKRGGTRWLKGGRPALGKEYPSLVLAISEKFSATLYNNTVKLSLLEWSSFSRKINVLFSCFAISFSVRTPEDLDS